MTFQHAGDIGDIIYALPAIKGLDNVAVLLIEAAKYTRQELTPERYAPLVPLLKRQRYIADVRPYMRQRVDVNFNEFRNRMVGAIRRRLPGALTTSLADWQLETCGLPTMWRDTPWLEADPRRVARVVVNRTARYHGPEFPWHRVWKTYLQSDAVFIGTPAEHEAFCAQCGELPYFPTADFKEAADVIAGADLFVGNQSSCFAIAVGLGQNAILEVWPQGPNCIFNRSNIINVTSWNPPLPPLP